MKKWLAVPMAVALMAMTVLYVSASENDSLLPCADIVDGLSAFTPASKDSMLGDQGWTTPGRLEFQVALAGPTCEDVEYNIVALAANPHGGAPVVLTSGSAAGDGISNKIAFDLEIGENAGEEVCVYVYTTGSTGASSSGKTGAAFDGTAPNGMLDRAPDGPASGGDYCILENEGSGGSRGYN